MYNQTGRSEMAASSCVVGTAVGTSKRTPDSPGGGRPVQLRPVPARGDTTGSAPEGGATVGRPARSHIYINKCIYIYTYTHRAI